MQSLPSPPWSSQNLWACLNCRALLGTLWNTRQETWVPEGEGIFQEISKPVLQLPQLLATHVAVSAKDTILSGVFSVSFSSCPLALKYWALHPFLWNNAGPMHNEIEPNSISGSRRVKSIYPMIKSNLNTSRGCTIGWAGGGGGREEELLVRRLLCGRTL